MPLLYWPAVQALDDATLERRLLSAAQQVPTYARANYGRIHQELRRKGVTLMLDCALDSEAVAPNVYRLVLDGCPVSEARPSPRPALIISARGLAAQSLPSATSEEVGSRAERDQSVSGIRR